jgi:predicted TIM-barrel fold metal-dependent hydrolase
MDLDSNGRIIRDTIAIFEPSRCMFASNFPVDGLTATYDEIVTCFQQAIAEHPPETRRALLHDNAVRVYRL